MITATFILYLVLMLTIGIMAYRQTSDLSDYILGGRNLGPLPSALSAGASDMSGWLLMGLPGFAMVAGLNAIWIAVGLLIGTWLNWLIVAKRLRVYSQKASDALTLPAFFEARFQDQQRHLRVVSASIILLFFLFYTSSGLVASGKLFETVFGLDYQLAVILGATAVVSYTLFGGFLAVSWTDVVQGLMMVCALIIVPVAALNELGGVASSVDAIVAQNANLLDVFVDNEGDAITLIGTLSLLGWGLGYFGQPHILARFKGIRSQGHVAQARRIAVAWSFLSMTGALLIGLIAIVYFPAGLDDAETVFMALVTALFHPLVAGVLLAAILAAVMSTADSQLLVASSALAEDFYKALFNQHASQQHLVLIGRIAVVVIAVVATLLALDQNAQVLELVSYAWAGFGAAFGPTLILSLYWRDMTKAGALAGIISGGVTVVVWKQLNGGWFDLYEIIPGTLIACVAIILVSKLSSTPCESIRGQFDEFESELR